jgi:hypothetical protein
MPKILTEEQIGEGLLMRQEGQFPPSSRKVIEEVGNEKVTKLTLYRYPISLSKFAKFIGALKNTPYDDLIHIGVVINNKYLTEKDAVLTFEKNGVPSQSTDTLDVPIGLKEFTINEMIDRTRNRMGATAFSTYCALNKGNCSNCQGYLKNMLDANGLSTAETTKFILQDLEQVTKNLPSYTNAIANFFTGAKAFINRQIQGEGDCQCGGGYLEDVAAKYPTEGRSLKESGERFANDISRVKKYYGYGDVEMVHNYQLHRAKCQF